MSLTVDDQEIMGEWYGELSNYMSIAPPQRRSYAVLRSWAYRRWMPQASDLAAGHAMMDFVLSSKFLELGPPQPAVVLAPAARGATVHAPADDVAHRRWLIGLALACAAVLGGLAGRGGLKDEVVRCMAAATEEAARDACPDWMPRP